MFKVWSALLGEEVAARLVMLSGADVLLLRVLRDHGQTYRVDLPEATGLHEGTVYRRVYDLIVRGLVEPVECGGYRAYRVTGSGVAALEAWESAALLLVAAFREEVAT